MYRIESMHLSHTTSSIQESLVSGGTSTYLSISFSHLFSLLFYLSFDRNFEIRVTLVIAFGFLSTILGTGGNLRIVLCRNMNAR